MDFNFDKEFFQRSWGPNGYYEEFNYGVGFRAVVKTCLEPFYNTNYNALEIGCGGGAFTKEMIDKFHHLTVVDVIKMPEQFEKYDHNWKFKYVELPDKCFATMQSFRSKDFVFTYNCFCHLSNEALKKYLEDIHYVLKPGGDFVFMIANFEHTKINVPDSSNYNLGDLLPIGHFYQDDRTLDLIADPSDWEIVNSNMIPEHRDIIIHLKKK